MAKDPQTIAALYRSGITGAAEKYKAGVKAAASDWETEAKSDSAEAAFAAGVQRAVAEKARQKGLQGVSGTEWAEAASEVGASNLTRAAPRAAANFEKQIPDIIAAGESAKSAAKAIPGVTMADRIQRAPAAAMAVHRHWARKKGINPEV